MGRKQKQTEKVFTKIIIFQKMLISFKYSGFTNKAVLCKITFINHRRQGTVSRVKIASIHVYSSTNKINTLKIKS